MLLSEVKSLQFQHVGNVWKFSGQADISNCPWTTDWNFKIFLYLYPNKEGKAALTTQLFGIYDIYFKVGSLIRKDVSNDDL